jgi:Tol biopolymer transport system component/DNA-binding winged helix-turn-helix (wHTH) protein
LSGQPIEVLTALVERSGAIVSREELQKRLWLEETYVDFDHSLNAAIKRLRAALGDSADAPRFVETVARQGYRFIAPLQYAAQTHSRPRHLGRPHSVESEVASSPAANDNEIRADLPAQPAEQKVSTVPQGIAHGEKRPGWRRYLPLAMAGTLLTIGGVLWLQRTEYFWRNPIAGARQQMITEFDGIEQDAAVSRDGQFVAFLSDRDGPLDVWVTQVGSGQFHNLTHGTAKDILNREIRSPGFSPDGSLVTFWKREETSANGQGISVWSASTLGGQPQPYLDGVVEFDWSRDSSKLVYHTPAPGDPMFVSDGQPKPGAQPIFTAPAGVHCHFQSWSPDMAFVYFVEGTFPDKLDIWRIASTGGTPERITSHHAHVTHPILLDQRTLLYLATDRDGSGPWLYGMDVERRKPHRLSTGLESYTSLAASADGLRLVATRANPKRSLWRIPISSSPATISMANRIALTSSTGFSPRLSPGYLLYVSTIGTRESIWKLANGKSTELWNAEDARVIGGPAISPDGQQFAFAVLQRGRTLLNLMQADGTSTRVVADSFGLQGSPAWTPDGKSIISAVDEGGVPRLFRFPLDGRSPERLVREYSVDPAWAPDGSFLIYSGPDVGTKFSVKAITQAAAPYSLPALNLTRGARRHLVLLSGGRELAYLRGEMEHKDLWLIDLKTGAERQLTSLPADFDVRDFDISPDGREAILERVQDRSDVVVLDLPRR